MKLINSPPTKAIAVNPAKITPPTIEPLMIALCPSVTLNSANASVTPCESAPANQLFEEFGFTVDNVLLVADELL